MESKLHPPRASLGLVPRAALLVRLSAAPAARVLCVAAPSGYGKPTLLAQWCERRTGRAAWVSLDRRDNDPVVLLVNQVCLDAVAEVALRLPAGSQLALASRARPSLPAALSRRAGQMVEVGADELAMEEGEARALLERAGVRPSGAEVAELLERTAGWPVGLYLASLAVAGESRRAGAGAARPGNGRAATGQAPAGLLSRLSQPTLAFLTRSAVLDELSGPLCDAVLQTNGSDRVLASLADSNLLQADHAARPGARPARSLAERLVAERLARRDGTVAVG